MRWRCLGEVAEQLGNEDEAVTDPKPYDISKRKVLEAGRCRPTMPLQGGPLSKPLSIACPRSQVTRQRLCSASRYLTERSLLPGRDQAPVQQRGGTARTATCTIDYPITRVHLADIT